MLLSRDRFPLAFLASRQTLQSRGSTRAWTDRSRAGPRARRDRGCGEGRDGEGIAMPSRRAPLAKLPELPATHPRGRGGRQLAFGGVGGLGACTSSAASSTASSASAALGSSPSLDSSPSVASSPRRTLRRRSSSPSSSLLGFVVLVAFVARRRRTRRRRSPLRPLRRLFFVYDLADGAPQEADLGAVGDLEDDEVVAPPCAPCRTCRPTVRTSSPFLTMRCSCSWAFFAAAADCRSCTA